MLGFLPLTYKPSILLSLVGRVYTDRLIYFSVTYRKKEERVRFSSIGGFRSLPLWSSPKFSVSTSSTSVFFVMFCSYQENSLLFNLRWY